MSEEWMLQRARRYPIERVVVSDDEAFSREPGFKRLRCPACGDMFQHVGRSQVVSGEDAYQAGWGGRGDLTVLPVQGECGHHWELCFGFHKGETFSFVRAPEEESAGE